MAKFKIGDTVVIKKYSKNINLFGINKEYYKKHLEGTLDHIEEISNLGDGFITYSLSLFPKLHIHESCLNYIQKNLKNNRPSLYDLR